MGLNLLNERHNRRRILKLFINLLQIFLKQSIRVIIKIQEISVKEIYTPWLLHKLTRVFNEKMRNITWFLSRNPKRKQVKWMWNGYKDRYSDRKAGDLM